MRSRLAAMVLVFEAITSALAIPVAANLATSDAAVEAFTLLAIFALLTTAALRRPGGIAVGWIVQAAMLATIVIVPAFAFVALPFCVLWWYCLRIGARIDLEREQLHGDGA